MTTIRRLTPDDVWNMAATYSNVENSPNVFTAALKELALDVERCLAGVVISAAGRATALEAADRRLEPDLVAKGHLADLVQDLEELWGTG